MDTFGCSFFVHSGWVSGSNGETLGVAGAARFCARPHGRKRRKSRRRGRRLAIEVTVGSCEDGVMVVTSPLTAKVGLWDTAGKERRHQVLHVSSQENCNKNFNFNFHHLEAPPPLNPVKKED